MPGPPASRRPAAASSPAYSPAPLSVMLADASPMGGRQITAIYQNTCGDPSRVTSGAGVAGSVRFTADPHNSDGGPITVTAHGVYPRNGAAAAGPARLR